MLSIIYFRACQIGNKDIVKILLQVGADGRFHPVTKYSPLYIACYHGHRDVVEMILLRFPELVQVIFNANNTIKGIIFILLATHCRKMVTYSCMFYKWSYNSFRTIVSISLPFTCFKNLQVILPCITNFIKLIVILCLETIAINGNI